MKIRAWFALGLCTLAPLSSLAIEHLFEGDNVTPIGTISIAEQPAGLAWVASKWSFSASASSLNKTYYEVQEAGFDNQDTPLSIKPMYVATGKGASWGGWVLHLQNSEIDFRSKASTSSGGIDSTADLRTKINGLAATIAAGLKLSENWSIGWGTRLVQLQQETLVIGKSFDGTDTTLTVQQSNYQAVLYALTMGAVMDYPNVRLGLSLQAPNQMLSETGEMNGRTLTTNGGQYAESKSDYILNRDQEWRVNAGVRLGREGSTVLLSDAYTSRGDHQPTVGWEYRGREYIWALSTSYRYYQGATNLKFVAGMVSKSENFDWGFGPSYEVDERSDQGAINSRSWNLLYATEIRY